MPSASALARQLTILSEDIAVRPQTVAAFEQARLWRAYDATEILERLPSLFGATPARGRCDVLNDCEPSTPSPKQRLADSSNATGFDMTLSPAQNKVIHPNSPIPL